MMTNEKLKKIYALAMNGIGGEKEQAKAMLDKLLEKYSLALEDLDETTVREYQLTFHGPEQQRILMQTIYKVTNNPDSFYDLCYIASGRKCRTSMGVRCTPSQKVEIEFLFDFYVSLWKQEQQALMSAFIQKHEIFGSSGGGNKRHYSDEEIKKMVSMMDGLSNAQPYKRLEDKDNF